MLGTFESYEDAFREAQKLADQCGREMGLEKANEYGRTVFSIKHLPNPGNRYGWELRCEVVTPTTSKGPQR